LAEKTFNNVKANVTIKTTETRRLLSTESEDLAVQLGKIQKWFPSLTTYAVCSTGASTATKEVSTSGDFVLSSGSLIMVKFANTNTANPSNLKLKVNSNIAADIRFQNTVLSSADKIEANSTYIFMYDGTYWQILSGVSNDIVVSKDSIGSASTGTPIPADDITGWTSNLPSTCTISEGVITFTAGTPANLQYTAKSIPNITVTSTDVVVDIN
jgi:hypothetical protein